jgi:bifunctional DNase/RNase
MLRMTVEGVGFDHLRQTVVVLKDWDSRKLLPIWIGAAEAKAIALHLEGTAPPRPLSHDLLLNCLRIAGGEISRVIINDLQDNTFYATIDLNTPNGTVHIDARPSDAIALAVRVRCPVFVDGGALDALIDIGESEEAPETEDGEEAPEVKPEIQTEAQNPATIDTSSLSSSSNDEDIDRFKRLVGDLDL